MAASLSSEPLATPHIAVRPSGEGLGREAEALCLAARVAPDEAARSRLRELLAGDVDWDHLWRLGHLHEVLPLLATTITGLGGVDAPDAWSADAQRRRSATLLQKSLAPR